MGDRPDSAPPLTAACTYTLSMPITRLNRGTYAQQSPLEQLEGAL